MFDDELAKRDGFARHEALSSSPQRPSTHQAIIEVTTLDDVVDASDGLVSLREAVQAANASLGLDTITFADDLRGGTLKLTEGQLVVTDDLVIDGDLRNRGSDGITITSSSRAFLVEDSSLGLQDLRVTGSGTSQGDLEHEFGDLADTYGVRLEGGAIGVVDGTLSIERVALLDNSSSTFSGPDLLIGAIGGLRSEITISDSAMEGNGAFGDPESGAAGILLAEGTLTVERTTLTEHRGTAMRGTGTFALRDVELLDNVSIYATPGLSLRGVITIADTVISRNYEDYLAAVALAGDVSIDGSTITGGSGGLWFSGDVMSITNSTIAGNADGSLVSDDSVGGLWIDRGKVTIVNSTITGNTAFVSDPGDPPGSIDTAAGGILVAPGAELELINTIVTGNLLRSHGGSPTGVIASDVSGDFTSGGNNLFGQTVLDGAVAGDRLGVDSREVFANSRPILGIVDLGGNVSYQPTGYYVGVLADNGGPTPTVALLDDPANPALDAADPASAPATDQRGLPRDATPDIGAFELIRPAPLVVTTLDDVVDATDGVLSLREAVDFANRLPGLDTIAFADELGGGTIALSLGALVISDDLVIDGGDGQIVVDGGSVLTDDGPGARQVFDVRADNAHFLDLTIAGGFTGIEASDANLTVERTTIRDPFPGINVFGGYVHGIRATGGELSVLDSRIEDRNIGDEPSEYRPGSFGIRVDDGNLLVENSVITGQSGYVYVVGIRVGNGTAVVRDSQITDLFTDDIAIGIRVNGSLLLQDSIISDFRGQFQSSGVSVIGEAEIENSTINNLQPRNFAGAYSSTAIAARGDLSLTNSTIAGITTNPSSIDRPQFSAAIRHYEGDALLVNNTITDVNVAAVFVGGQAGSARLFNNLIVGNGRDIVDTSNLELAGNIIGDRDGVTPDQVFATGRLADNGGPTPTIALLDDPANPALDAADPATAPATDQRGFLRDATPDIGAFELIRPAPLVVTTLDDVVDATDGVLSLREAVTLANTNPGRDTITFAEELRGGTIQITGGGMAVTDTLIIDGDTDDGGPSRIVISGGGAPFVGSESSLLDIAENVDLTLQDLSIREVVVFDGARVINGSRDGAVLRLERVELSDNSEGTGPLINSLDRLLMTDSAILRNSGGAGSINEIRISSSVISDNNNPGSATLSGREISIDTSTVSRNIGAGTVIGGYDITVSNSTVAENSAQYAAVQGRDILVVNSSLVGNYATLPSSVSLPFRGSGAALTGGSVEVVNSTITGNVTDDRGFSAVHRGGIFANELTLSNSIVTGNLRTGFGFAAYGGFPVADVPPSPSDLNLVLPPLIDRDRSPLTSNGANIIGEMSYIGMDGLQPTDLIGITADQVFAQTLPVAGSGVGEPILAGILADNGGPTLTVALLDDPANPALDAADPATAPPTDQRGLFRDATPDIGAFELGGTVLPPPPPPVPPLPPLAEKVPLADADIVGVPRAALTLVGGDAAIAFVDEYAAYQSSLGVYLIGPGGEILSTAWAFARIEHAEPSDLASPAARPGGGPLSPGDEVLLSDLFDPGELAAGTEFGLFLVADGWSRNPSTVFDGGTLAFRSSGEPATVTDRTPQLVHIDDLGGERLVLGDILHTVDAGSPNPLSNSLNPGGGGQATSGFLDGQFVVAFEDKPLAKSDRDFNDAIFAVDVLDVSSGAQVATIEASLDTLVVAEQAD